MIDFLKTWITSIAALLIIFTAIQILIPNNAFKKYINFTFGLLLTYVMISPVLSFLNKDFNAPNSLFINYYIANKDIEQNRESSLETTMASSMKLFETNLQKLVIDSLDKKYPINDYNVEVKSKYNEGIISIDKITVHVFPKGVKPVENIQIGENTTNVKINGYENIINFISEEFNIDIKNIYVIEG